MREDVANDINSDLKAICDSIYIRRPIDPAIIQRVQEQAAIIRCELAANGLIRIADELLRESRV
jgi:hypothetical protein